MLEHGQVFLTPHETVRLIRKELGTYINSKIINAKTPTMIPGFEDSVNKLAFHYQKNSKQLLLLLENIHHALNMQLKY